MTDTRTATELRAEADRLEQLATERDTQLTRDDLVDMTPTAIAEAFDTGRLQQLLNPTPNEGA